MNSIDNYSEKVCIQNNAPSFRAFKMSNQAKRIIENKIKNQKQWDLLDKFIKSQEKNPVEINIDIDWNKKGKRILRAKIGNYEQFEKYGLDTDNTIDSLNVYGMFFNPVKFIKNLCKKANKAEKSLTDFNDVLKNIPEK